MHEIGLKYNGADKISDTKRSQFCSQSPLLAERINHIYYNLGIHDCMYEKCIKWYE
jgi:hypothetical protein